MNIFVGNLDSQITEKELQQLFSPYGEVRSVKIIRDTGTGRSRGFGFVNMPEQYSAERAISSLDNTMLHGQMMIVNESIASTVEESFGRRRN